jgi:hypothetical protein
MVAIGLQKPYAKSESDKNLVMYDVHELATMCVHLWDQNTWNTFPKSEQCTIIKQLIGIANIQLTAQIFNDWGRR